MAKGITRAALRADGTAVKLGRGGKASPLKPRVDWAKVDATGERAIARHKAKDDAAAMRDAGAYVRGLREKTGYSQAEFAKAIRVPLDTVRNWEQGRRTPRGPALALLRILAKLPGEAMKALA